MIWLALYSVLCILLGVLLGFGWAARLMDWTPPARRAKREGQL